MTQAASELYNNRQFWITRLFRQSDYIKALKKLPMSDRNREIIDSALYVKEEIIEKRIVDITIEKRQELMYHNE
jgi:hypothetical protein